MIPTFLYGIWILHMHVQVLLSLIILVKLFLLEIGQCVTERVDGLEAYNICSILCGEFHSLAVNEWGQVFSWGASTYGQLGKLWNCQ